MAMTDRWADKLSGAATAHYYRQMTVALSIVTPIITSGLGPAAQYGVNALIMLIEPELL